MKLIQSKSSNFMMIKGLFTWREEDPSTRKILEGGTTFRFIKTFVVGPS